MQSSRTPHPLGTSCLEVRAKVRGSGACALCDKQVSNILSEGCNRHAELNCPTAGQSTRGSKMQRRVQQRAQVEAEVHGDTRCEGQLDRTQAEAEMTDAGQQGSQKAFNVPQPRHCTSSLEPLPPNRRKLTPHSWISPKCPFFTANLLRGLVSGQAAARRGWRAARGGFLARALPYSCVWGYGQTLHPGADTACD